MVKKSYFAPVYLLVFLLKSVTTDVTQDIMSKAQFSSYSKFLDNQNRLWKDLFTDYDPTISAIYTLYTSEFINQTATIHPPMTQLNLTMTMLKLVDVVEVEEKVTFLFDYQAEWTDTRLRWNPLEYGGISHIYVPHMKVWLPEITIADAHEIKYFTSADAPGTAWIYHNGTVGFYTSTVSSVICSMDVYRFPMDKHTCGVSVLFYTYFTNEYMIKSSMESFTKPVSELGNGEWEVTWVGIAVEQSYNVNKSTVQRFEAKMSRNPGFYVALVMVPAYFINFLSIVALFIDMENVGEKITIGLTNIMAMTFILVILAADLPKTKKIPLLAIYVIVGLVIVMVSIACVFIIPPLRRRQERNKKKNNEVETPEIGRFSHLTKFFRIEYFLMVIFQIANFVNFIILFL